MSRRKAAAKAGAPGHNRRLGILAGVGARVVVAGAVFLLNQLPSASPTLLAGTDGQAQGQPVDGISCETSEQVVYHIHAHLAVYTNGKARSIPEGIGIVPPTQIVQTSSGPFVVAG